MSRSQSDYGIKEWYNSPASTFDICFIHGLIGHPDKTWTVQQSKQPWPQSILPSKFPSARILTFGYNTSVDHVGVAPGETIATLAKSLLRSLLRLRQESGSLHRPVIFVVHSLGGIICKKAIALSHQRCPNDIQGSLVSSLVGVIFMGTPHNGCDFADAAGLLLKSVSWLKPANKSLLEALRKDSQMAEGIEAEFRDACQSERKTSLNQVQIFCFFETLPSQAGKPFIVPQTSAVYQQHQYSQMHANHTDMVRFSSEDTAGFKNFCSTLHDFLLSPRAAVSSPRCHSLSLQNPEHGTSRPGSPILPISNPEPRPESPESCLGYCQPLCLSPAAFIHDPEPRSDSPPPLSLSAKKSTTTASRTATACYYLPFHRNPNFVGRDDVLHELQTLLFEEEFPAVALRGLGGVGKTQVANALAHWVKRNKSDYSVFWVPALSSSSFQKAYESIASKLKITKWHQKNIQRMQKITGGVPEDNRDIKQVVRDYLSSDDAGRWLLVLDNADDEELVCGDEKSIGLGDFIPRSDSGRVLVTTRTTAVASSLASDTVVLDEFDFHQALTLATKLLKRNIPKTKEDKDALTELLRELSYLPLAITQAMAYLNVSGLSTAAYLRKLCLTEVDRLDLLSKESQDNTRYKESRHAIAATWLVSFEHLEKRSPDAIALLGFLSQIQPKAIPLSLLPKFVSNSGTMNVITELCEYSFVSLQNDDMLDMHSLVHMASRSWFDKSGKSEENAKLAMEHIKDIFPLPGRKTCDIWRVFLPHALYVLQSREAVDSRVSFDLCVRAGKCLDYDDRDSEALKCFESSMEWADANLPEDHDDRVDLQYSMAIVCNANRQHQKAAGLLEHVLKARETLPATNPRRLLVHSELAIAYGNTGRLQEGFSLLEYVMGMQTHLPENHSDRLFSLSRLSRLYIWDGQLKKAVELLEHIVKLPEDDYDRVVYQCDLGMAYFDMGETQKALQIFKHVAGLEEALSASDINRAATQYGIACTYEDMGDLQKAKEVFQHTVQLLESLPEEDFQRLFIQLRLARVYGETGDFQKAKELLELVSKLEKALPEGGPVRLLIQHGLACVYEETGDLQKAKELFEHIVKLEEALPEESPDRLITQHGLACVCEETGDLQKAKELFEHILKFEKSLPKKSRNRLLTRYRLACVYERTGDLQKAKELFEHVVKLEETLPKESPDRLITQYRLACVYAKTGDVQKAKELFEHIVKLEETLPEESPDRLITQYRLACVYEHTGDFQKAKKLLEHVVKLDEALPEESSDRLLTQYRLACIYERTGDLQQAKELFEHVVKFEDNAPVDGRHLRVRLACVYERTGDLQQAKELFEYIIKLEEFLPKESPDRLITQYRLACVYEETGDLQQAKELFEHIIKLEEALPEESPDRLITQYRLACVYEDTGDLHQAKELFEHVVKLEEVLPEESPDRLITQYRLACVYAETGDVQKAKELFEYVVKLEEALPEESPDRLLTQHGLACVCEETGDFQKAKKLFEHVLKFAEFLPEESPDRLLTQYRLACVYEDTGDLEGARDMFEHMLNSYTRFVEDDVGRLYLQQKLASVTFGLGQKEKGLQLMQNVFSMMQGWAEDDPHRVDAQECLAWMEGEPADSDSDERVTDVKLSSSEDFPAV